MSVGRKVGEWAAMIYVSIITFPTLKQSYTNRETTSEHDQAARHNTYGMLLFDDITAVLLLWVRAPFILRIFF